MKHLLLFIFVAALIGLSACRSVPERVQERLPEVRTDWEAALERQANPDSVFVLDSWDQAVALIFDSNLKFRAAINDAYFAEKEVSMVYRRLLPELNLFASFSKPIGEFSSIDSNDVFLVANGFLQLPNPIEVRARALSAQLFNLRAGIGGQLLVRELHAQLYRLHRSHQSISEMEARVRSLLELSEAIRDSSPERASDLELQARELDLELRSSFASFQAECGELFGKAGVLYRFSEDFNSPRLTYAWDSKGVDALKEMGKLQSTEAATQMVGMDLRELGIRIDQFPRLSSFASIPNLWTARGSDSNYADFDQTRVGINLSWSTDFRGIRSLNKERVLVDHQLQRELIDQQIEAKANELTLVQREAKELVAERAKILRQIELLEPFAKSDVRSVRSMSNDRLANLQSALTALDDRISEINILFWTLDDAQWEMMAGLQGGIFALNL